MNRSWLRIGVLFVFAFSAFVLPHTSFAANPFTDPIFPKECLCDNQVNPAGGSITSAASWGCILQVIQNLINAAVAFGVILCVMWIAFAGFSLMISGGNPESYSQAKTRLVNAVVGIAVILCSWVTVDFVLKVVYNPNAAFDGYFFGPWNNILGSVGDDMCLAVTTPTAIYTGTVGILTGSTNPGQSSSMTGIEGVGGGGVNQGAGSCTPAKIGPCNVNNLRNSCFGANAQQASSICNRESGGSAATLSSTDKLDSGKGPAYSVGLWQINLTVHKVGGLNCPAAFSAKCGREYGTKVGPKNLGYCSATVVNQDLYKKCVLAAQNPQNSMQFACGLYNGNSFKPWNNECALR